MTSNLPCCNDHLMNLSRRHFLGMSALGLGSIALAAGGLDARASSPNLVQPTIFPNFPAKAKRVVYLFQSGGPSHLETFDPKPALNQHHGEPLPDSVRRGQRLTGMSGNQSILPLAGSFTKFQQHGNSRAWISDLLPHTAPQREQVIARSPVVFVEAEDDAQIIIRTRLQRKACLEARTPQLISMQEVGPGLEPVMRAQLAIAYPHMRILARADNYGIALLSKAPFQEARFVELEGVPIVDAVIASSSGAVRVVSVHTTSPGNVSQFRERNAQLIALERLLGTSTLPTVLVGDLNTVPWDSAFGRLCRAAGFHGNHQGIRATWPSFMGLALIPLDHVLVTPQLEVLGLTRFTIPGSDHRGLVATLRDR